MVDPADEGVSMLGLLNALKCRRTERMRTGRSTRSGFMTSGSDEHSAPGNHRPAFHTTSCGGKSQYPEGVKPKLSHLSDWASA